MLNKQKPPIFTIHKIKKNGYYLNKSLNRRDNLNSPNKKRLPWMKEVNTFISNINRKTMRLFYWLINTVQKIGP